MHSNGPARRVDVAQAPRTSRDPHGKTRAVSAAQGAAKLRRPRRVRAPVMQTTPEQAACNDASELQIGTTSTGGKRAGGHDKKATGRDDRRGACTAAAHRDPTEP